MTGEVQQARSCSPETDTAGRINSPENTHDNPMDQPNHEEVPDQLRAQPRLSSLQTSERLSSSYDAPVVDGASHASTVPPLGGRFASFPSRQVNFAAARAIEQPDPWRDLRESIIDLLRVWIDMVLTPFTPFSGFSQVRYLMVLLVTTTYVVFFPLGFAFPDVEQFTYVDGAVGVLLVLDVLLSLHTSFMQPDGTIVTSHREIARHYLKTRFVVDALLTIPLVAHVDNKAGRKFGGTWLHLFLDILSAERLAFFARFVRMIWLMRLNQSGSGNSFWAWLLYSRYSHLLRIAGIVTMLVGIAHYIACVWNVLLEKRRRLE